MSVRAVAQRAGVSTGLLYSYFANLSDLMRSIWMVPIAELGRSLTAVEASEPDPLQRIRRLLETYVDFTIADDETHRGLLLWVRPPNSTTDRNDDPNELMFFSSLRRAVEAGQSAGDDSRRRPHDPCATAVVRRPWRPRTADQHRHLRPRRRHRHGHRDDHDPRPLHHPEGRPMTLLDDPRPISADSHALEGPAVFEGLPERFGDDAPRVVHREGQGDYIVTPNQPARSRNVAVMALAGTRLDYETPLPREHASKPGAGSLDDPEIQAYFTGGYAAMRPGLTNGAHRPDDQDIDGVSAEILYPGWFPMFSLQNLDLMVALQRNYNDWMHAQQVASKGRLIGLAALPVQRPDEAVSELERVIDLGFKGVVIPSNAPRGRRYSDEDYGPMWALAEEAGLPIVFHVACMSHVPDWLKAMRGSRPDRAVRRVAGAHPRHPDRVDGSRRVRSAP